MSQIKVERNAGHDIYDMCRDSWNWQKKIRKGMGANNVPFYKAFNFAKTPPNNILYQIIKSVKGS